MKNERPTVGIMTARTTETTQREENELRLEEGLYDRDTATVGRKVEFKNEENSEIEKHRNFSAFDKNTLPNMSTYGSDTNLGGFENSFSEKRIRMAFVRKVYGILMLQLAITVGFIALFTYQPDVKMFALRNPSLFWVAFAATFILLIVMACFTNVRRNFPTNMICLFLFTIFESILLGFATSVYDAEAVLIAVGICALVCLGLTIFACQTKFDFTTCSGVLFVSLLVLLIFGIIAAFIPGKVVQIIYAALGALIFSLYLVFDTQMMLGGNHKYSLSPEEYIFAALNIYLDIINLFLMILQLVGAARD